MMRSKLRKRMNAIRTRLKELSIPEDSDLYSLKDIFKHLWAIKGIIILLMALLFPMDLLATVDGHNLKRSKCAYVIIVMAILWLTEALPIAVTALIPIFLFPMLQVSDAREISASYITDTSMLFLGGLILAVAVEEWNLHKRIAVSVMRLIGAHPSMLMLGLMLPTWFLSMWISNTAATSMMIPIIQAVVHTLDEVHLQAYANRGTRNPAFQPDSISGHSSELSLGDARISLQRLNDVHTGSKSSSLNSIAEGSRPVSPASKGSTNGTVASSVSSSHPILGSQKSVASAVSSQTTTSFNKIPSKESLSASSRELHRLSKALALSVAFAANIGGIATLTGTPPNLVLKGMADEELHRLSKALALSVAFAANIGGIATLTGTPPNLVLKGMADELYANKSGDKNMESPITFANWMGFAFPLSIIVLVLAWLWLLLYFFHGKCFKKQEEEAKEAVNAVIKAQFKSLGFLSFAEVVIIAVFFALVFLWLFREPPNFDGWGAAFTDPITQHKYVTDSTPVMLLSVSLFILPAKVPNIFCWSEDRDSPSYTPILTWQLVEKKVSWGVIVLLGGGFAIARASKDSGLSDWLGNELTVFSSHEPWVMNFIFTLIISMATEVTSNTAMATLLMPVLGSVALATDLHPLYLMISAAMSVSFAFMLPVATPPNAIVFSTGYLTITDMAYTGLPMSLFAVFVLILAINTWGDAIYDFQNLPEFFKNNVTASSNVTVT